MGMVNVTAEVVGEAKLVRAFKGISEKLKDFKDIFKKIVPEFNKMEEQIFGRQGAVSPNNRWQDLSDVYAQQKIKLVRAGKYISMDVLIATGRLKQSLTSKTSDSIIDIKDTEMLIGTDGNKIKYAITHQKGTGRIPKRKFVFISSEFKNEIIKIFKEGLNKNIESEINNNL
jgi:phage gpG-like protein